MWLFLSNAFLSIVAHDTDKSMLRVRARSEEDIQRVFPFAKVERMKRSDYAYHADVERSVVAVKLAGLAHDLNYTNFKNSVGENDRHNSYVSVWTAMRRFQDDREFGPRQELPDPLSAPIYSWPPSRPLGGAGSLWGGLGKKDVGWKTTPLKGKGDDAEVDVALDEPVTDAELEAAVAVGSRLDKHLALGFHGTPRRTRRHLARIHEVVGLGPTEDPETLHEELHDQFELEQEHRLEGFDAPSATTPDDSPPSLSADTSTTSPSSPSSPLESPVGSASPKLEDY